MLAGNEGACLIVSVEPDEATAIKLVRKLRLAGSEIPVIALGSNTDFRTATEIARLEFTDFLGRPLIDHKMLTAVEFACGIKK